MLKRLLAVSAAFALSSATAAVSMENEEQAVLAAVQQFFDAMSSKDVEKAREVLDPKGSFVSVRPVDGEQVVRRSSFGDFLARLETMEGDMLERMWEPEVMIHREIALVWTAYDFHNDGKFSHCGMDLFQLVRTGGDWKITGGSYTVEPNGCADSPLGPPK